MRYSILFKKQPSCAVALLFYVFLETIEGGGTVNLRRRERIGQAFAIFP